MARFIPLLSGIVGGFQGYNSIKDKKDVYCYLGISTGFLSIYAFTFGAGIVSSVLAASTVNGGFYGIGYFAGKMIR